MSTKSTIAYSDEFHFYHDCFDNKNVYLELTGMEFAASNGNVMVSIPMHIWEVIALPPTSKLKQGLSL